MKRVALFTRAWIEIPAHLSRAGGCVVALFTRAWIEMQRLCFACRPRHVALFTRAWIEIASGQDIQISRLVALFTRAWIEIRCGKFWKCLLQSPSSRGRGLKLTLQWIYLSLTQSPSSRGRGLKFCALSDQQIFTKVALFTRAWIEIKIFFIASYMRARRPLHEGVD